MQFVECPHCYARVLPSEAGICPSCQKDIHDTRGANPNIKPLIVYEGRRLPNYCMLCNAPTENFIKISDRVEEGGDSPLAKIVIFLGALLLLLTLRHLFIRYGPSGKQQSVIVRVPICGECLKAGRPKPIFVDFHKRSMTFLVDRGFRERVYRSLNKR
jgi:hypothetical protein